MIGMAAGMAMYGLRPVAYTITPFITTRCLEQIRVDVCYHDVPVTIVGVGGRPVLRLARPDAPFLRRHRLAARAAEHGGRLPRRRRRGAAGAAGGVSAAERHLHPPRQEGRAGHPQDAAGVRHRQGDRAPHGARRLPARAPATCCPKSLEAADQLETRRHRAAGGQLPHGQAAGRGLPGRAPSANFALVATIEEHSLIGGFGCRRGGMAGRPAAAARDRCAASARRTSSCTNPANRNTPGSISA